MSAFVTGINLTAALVCGAAWVDDRRRFNAVAFWFNLVVGALNAWAWLG